LLTWANDRMIFVNERVSVVHLLIIIVVAYLVYTGTVRLGSVFGAVFLAFLGILAFYLEPVPQGFLVVPWSFHLASSWGLSQGEIHQLNPFTRKHIPFLLLRPPICQQIPIHIVGKPMIWIGNFPKGMRLADDSIYIRNCSQ
jgi:hypothetical protein